MGKVRSSFFKDTDFVIKNHYNYQDQQIHFNFPKRRNGIQVIFDISKMQCCFKTLFGIQ